MFKFICACCGWSEGADRLPEVFGICDRCAEVEVSSTSTEVEMFEDEDEDEVYREDGLR